jgi:hypothetical protein
MTTDQDEQPDHTDAGRGRDIGSGYPEEQPGGANPGPAKSGSSGSGDKPDTSGNQDSDPGAATGNPGAAGADG